MLPKVICLIFVINTLNSFCDGIAISERNETNLVLSLNIEQAKLREEQDLQRNLIDKLAKKSDVEDLQEKLIEGLQSLRAEQERQGKLIDGLTRQLEHLGSSILDGLSKELDQRKLRSNPRNCADDMVSGIYEIHLSTPGSQPFRVACDAKTRGGGWTIILRRLDGSVNFYRNWSEYKTGFGDLSGEFFLGLDKIHALTKENSQELLVLLEDFEGNERYQMYDQFAIGAEDQQYVLHTLGKSSGNAGDSLSYHHHEKFTTFDRDNDQWQEGNCAENRSGAWWYYSCFFSHLTGKYNDNSSHKGVIWESFKGFDYSLKRALMMIRPKK
ncbi:hypothetical protein ACLKA7_004803 [Drosophila subpalustris]